MVVSEIIETLTTDTLKPFFLFFSLSCLLREQTWILGNTKTASNSATDTSRKTRTLWAKSLQWNDLKWSDVKWSNVKWCEVKWCEVKWREGKWCEVVWSDVMWSYVKLCEVVWSDVKGREVILFFLFVLYFCFLFCVFCVSVLFSYYFVYFFLLLCCLFPILVQIYRPLPPRGNPTAVNKYHIYIYIISYQFVTERKCHRTNDNNPFQFIH
jgi:hypothetical protein